MNTPELLERKTNSEEPSKKKASPPQPSSKDPVEVVHTKSLPKKLIFSLEDGFWKIKFKNPKEDPLNIMEFRLLERAIKHAYDLYRFKNRLQLQLERQETSDGKR